ncbi:E3 ubiquitin-protein ligase rnf213-alpha-like [Astyanax mexicanus]|uniref:E3 ubiquitin-protein ligase rnf213-alpha-like n=1 Tax=Astyanax mexicanus TaxID=7994 RepID=UPI0020CB0101|nr:E3 ubiquitin-protein ligase rnf213-alpha-like [Astyanax mexicanus]
MEMLNRDESESDGGSDTYLSNIQMFEKIDLLSESKHFKEMWRKTTKRVKETEFGNVEKIPLHQVYKRIYLPTFEEFRKSYEGLKDLSMSLTDLEDKMGKFLKGGIQKELKTMADVFSKETRPTWTENTLQHIKRYTELQSVEENVEVISDLKDHLRLGEDFERIKDFGNMDHKCLRDLTEDVCRVGESVKNIPENVISFLKEFDNCITRGFIDWIKGIIKDTGELTAFVELASISAGENAMDIGKVCCFRDAISASTPLIYQLPQESGIKDLLQAISKLTSALENDPLLEDKLRDSYNNKEWLKIAYETHGSVERSSLRQATDINESGMYIIKRPSEAQSKVTLENCITLRCKEGSSNGKDEYKTYSLAELKELQNKLMLITAGAEKREDEITTYVEVLEHVINVGKSFLELRDAGHILFQDWEMRAYCQRKHAVRIWVIFHITDVEIKGNRPLLEELKGISESMRGCLSEWVKDMEQKRNTYYTLNHFTAKQLVYLCRSVAEFQKDETISARLLNMLSIMKENIKEADVRNALIKAFQTPVESGESGASLNLTKFLTDYPAMIEYFLESGFTEEEIKAAIMFCEKEQQAVGTANSEEHRDAVMECIDEHQGDKEWVQEWCKKYEETDNEVRDTQMKFKGGQTADVSFSMTEEQTAAAFKNLKNSDEKIVMLWKIYHNKLSGFVSDKFVDLDVLGEMMNHLVKSAEEFTVKRKLPFNLEGGKPYLISCKDAEILPLCLSLYKDNEQPLPSFDEILICTPETTIEEVELILRRAMQPGSSHEKIYSLVKADKLNHDVSRKFESIFYKLNKNAGNTNSSNYRLIIFCDSKAHQSYVATAFDLFKTTISENPNRNEEIKQYLRHKHQTPSGAESSEQFQLRTKLIFSDQAGMGKSLYVKNLVRISEEKLKDEGFTHKTIRISESHLRTENIAKQLQQYEDKPMDKVPRIFHFDIPPVVSKGLYTFLVQLFVLRCFQSPDGDIWRCNDSHIYLVEYTKRKHRKCDQHSPEISFQMEETFLEMFPCVKCLSPEETQTYLEQGGSGDEENQLMDHSEFISEAFQRTYQYFKRYRSNQVEGFTFSSESPEDSPKEWLECLLQFCDIKNPSWGELRNFTHFLNSQLKKCEQSVFCSEFLKDDLKGFKTFVVKFMITMSKDFSMRSLKTSDDSDDTEEEAAEDDTVLSEFQLRRRWEQQAHPYILFNHDKNSMTFLGFHIPEPKVPILLARFHVGYLDAIDPRTKTIVEKNIIDSQLFAQLKEQGVPFNIGFETLDRDKQLDTISKVLGVENVKDPDDTYQLTLDNVMKMLAIHLRFESDIPVIIMGETGCGKTRLVQFMCDLMRSGRQIQNLIVVRVHGGTTSEIIYKKVRDAIEIAKKNEKHDLDTVLFFDEANTTEAVNAIKEVICDKSVNGEEIDAPRLKIIAACNPYRKHSKEAIEQLERAGLGYRVRCENTEEKLGQIPMRQLVYRVQPLPPSLTPLVWDFGKLNEQTQELYITQMVKTFFRKEKLPNEHQLLFTKVISVSQKHMMELKDECRMVSLRDIERCMKTVMWFYHQKETLFPEIDRIRGEKGTVDDLVRALILAVGVCYSASLENREAFLNRVSDAFSPSCADIHTEIDLCKKAFISNVDCPTKVAKNDALMENVFMMVVCMNLRIPLFLVGKPGSSKSLSKTIAAHAMQGKASQNDLFKEYKQAQLASFQCSPHSSPDGIVSVFRQCAQFQKGKNLDEYVSVVVLDEIGLAEDSPKMPLKTLHPLLEYGCIDDEHAEDFKKVGFIGISNWSLDPAKMNRGILVLRTSPESEDLENTAKDICSSDNENINTEMKFLIPTLTKFYLRVLNEQTSEFFGLRDFYSLVKLIVSYATEANGRPCNEDLTRAVQRNFEGLDSIDVLNIFWEVLKDKTQKCDTISLLRENLDMETSGFASRYLLLPTINHAALQILKTQKIINENNTEVIFGSGFPRDEEYSQVCRTVNRVKTCMETGRSVVLLNIQSLYESLYDALNQCYVKLGGSYYVDLGLGSHRVKCRVKDEFRLIVIEEKSTVYEQFPTPLLNRLEKHCLEISNILPEHAKQMQAELERWLDSFVTNSLTDIYQSEEHLNISRKKHDIIVGYTEDICASVLLQCCPEIVQQELDAEMREETLEKAKEMLLQCATPDSVLRATKYMKNSEKLLQVYFAVQPHGSLIEMLKKYRETNNEGISIEVSTYSRLLNKRDVEQINKELDICEDHSCLFLLDEFYTEQSFSQTVSEFLRSDVRGRKLLILQTFFDEPKKSQRLLFCVRHSITQLRSSIRAGVTFDVLLLTRLPRISGGCGYIASFGDDWTSFHLDELIPPPGFPGDIYTLQYMTIAEILEKSFTSQKGAHDQDSCGTTFPKEQVELSDTDLVDVLFLVKSSLQKGILLLHDKADNTQRATKRIEMLHGLLHNRHPESEIFIQALKRRIISLLHDQEKMKDRVNWVINQASSDRFVAEGGSFRHMLWIHLEDTVASALAQILAVIDGDNNLDNLIDQPSEKSELWLNVFKENNCNLLKIPVTQFQGMVSVLSTSGQKDKSRTCCFPFSWVIKERFEQIWSNIINVKGPLTKPNKEYLEKFEEYITLPWIKSIRKDQELFTMFSEDLVNMFMPTYPAELNKCFSETVRRLTSRLYQDLTEDEPENVSLPWLFVTNEYMHDNHQLFYNLYLQDNSLVAAGEATEALRQTLKNLQPKESVLKDFDSCQEWLHRVKSLSLTVDLILSEDSLVTSHSENATEINTEIRLSWQSTWIIYLLMDHLLQNEWEMEIKLLTVLVRRLTSTWKSLNKEEGKQMEYVVEQVTGALNKCSKNACNVFKVVCLYCDKDFTEDDTAELQCGHMFHMSCLKANNDTHCKKCKKEIKHDHKPCGAVDKETFLKVNRFRRKCNSFFVEFMWNFVSSKDQLTDSVLNMLMDYMKGIPSTEGTAEHSSLQNCIKPDHVLQSYVLKILLKCGMEETAPQLQRFIEEVVKSNERNSDELYFMVVRSIKDHIYFSSLGSSLIKKAKECLDSCLFVKSDEAIISHQLYTLAKLRFAISVAADTITTALSEEQPADPEESEYLLQSVKELILKNGNPWIQIFLLRNLCNLNGFSFIHQLGRSERFQWTIPTEVLEEQNMPAEQVDHFLIYGEMYGKITCEAVKALEDSSYDITTAFDETSAAFRVCMALAAVRQTTLNRSSRDNEGSLMERMKTMSTTDCKWSELVTLCEKVLDQDQLAEVAPAGLSQIIFHTALIAKLSTAPEMELLKTLCFSPGNAKDYFFPTMPSSINEINDWADNVKIWECNCGEPVFIGECGWPNMKGKCLNCQSEVGGENHNAVDGFKEFENTDKSGRGHSLGDPNSRREQHGERNLYGANLCLVRAILHSSMLWGTTEQPEEIQNVIQTRPDDVRRHLLGHLQKDIELLGKVIGKNTEDAIITVHLFLKFMLENGSEPNSRIQMMDTGKKRQEWEDSIEKRLKDFFKNFETELSSVQSNILESGGMNTLAQIIYSKEPQLKNLPTTGVFNRPLLWSFEQRMTIQHLTHLIEQNDGRKNVPVLSELLKEHFHIPYIRYLPQVLSLQQKLMCQFENVDPQCYKDVSINTFMRENVEGEDAKQAFTENAAAMKEIWGHLKKIKYPKLPQELVDKDVTDLMILDLLPTEKSVAQIITEYLVRTQNDFINLTNPGADRYISASEVKPSHVITCIPEHDFLTTAISNIDHIVFEDRQKSTNYNFRAVERQLVDRFFMEKPTIKLSTLPVYDYKTGTTLRAFFSTVKDQLEPLNTNDRNCIMNDFRFLNEISSALSTLNIAIGFMKLSFPQPDQFLMTYLKKDLKLEDKAQNLSLPVLRTSKVKHIQSLWEVLSLRQSSLLIEMNQNPFFMIEDQRFHEVFTEEQKKEKKETLAHLTNIDVLITELHYVIMNIKFKEIGPDWP